MKGLLLEVGYWSLFLAGSVLLSFTPWIAKSAVNSTLTEEERTRIERYEEELRRQGIDQ
jgi:hypothetical protein